jgi:tetratricopeptide (TPR) repeat protein
MDQVPETLNYYQLRMKIGQKLAADDPGDARAQRDLSVAHNKLGDVRLRTGQVEEALTHYKLGLEIRQKLAPANPDDAQAQRDLIYSLRMIAQAEKQRFNYDAAIEQIQEGVGVLNARVRAGLLVESSKREIKELQSLIDYYRDAKTAMGELKVVLSQGTGVTGKLLSTRIMELARKGELAAVLTACDQLRKLPSATPGNVYDAACGYCLAALIVMQPPRGGFLSRKPAPRELSADERAQQQKYLDLAAATLREAVAAGFDRLSHMEKDSDLNPLREHPEYRKLVAELKGRKSSAKTAVP